MKDRELQKLGLYQIGNSFVQISAQSPGDLQRAQHILQNSSGVRHVSPKMENVERLLRSNGIILSDLDKISQTKRSNASTVPRYWENSEDAQI